MFKFFRQSLMYVDYGEQELCGEQALLHVAEYQHYLSSSASLCLDLSQEKRADSTYSPGLYHGKAQRS